MHGGALGSRAPLGNKNALNNGRYVKEAMEQRGQPRELMRQSRKFILDIGELPGGDV